MLQYMTYEQALQFTGFVAVAITMVTGKKIEVALVEKSELEPASAMSVQREKEERTRHLMRSHHATRLRFRDRGYGRQFRTMY